MKNILFFVAILLLPTVANATENKFDSTAVTPTHVDKTVFGFNLGDKLELTECNKKIQYGIINYDIPTSGICYKNTFRDDWKNIVFSESEKPDIIFGQDIIAFIVEGKLEGINFTTFGYTAQQRVLSALTKKYGEPSTLNPMTLRNKYGVEYKVFTAIWDFIDINVEYSSVTSELDRGTVLIQTRKEHEKRMQKLKETNKEVRPL
jgi:hypothetical protein